ncbi:MAG TPA: queuosine precursor transporter [Allosphingosinicella sp.]
MSTSAAPASAPAIPRALFIYALLYGGLVCTAGVLGTKLASLGTWPVIGSLAVESGIFAFLILVVLSSAVAELYGRDTANRLVRFGFVPLVVSMLLIQFVIHVVPPASFWDKQPEFEVILGQSSRMMFAGIIAYGTSQTLNVYIFSRIAAKEGSALWLRALIASFLSQIVDTLLFITIAFYGVFPIAGIMGGQIIAKLTLSVIMVPPLIYLFVALGRRLDAQD